MKRKIISIDSGLCNGCGSCVSACSEGALQIIDGIATLVKEDYCDGFGDCMGECPTGALKVEEKEAPSFDIDATKQYLLETKGREAVRRMEKAQKKHEAVTRGPLACGCPGSMTVIIDRTEPVASSGRAASGSELTNWPVQIHLLPLKADHYRGAHLLVAADCCAYSYDRFHGDFIRGHTVAIGCPKLDDAGSYKEKLSAILSQNEIESVAVAFMEVPCCGGLVKLVEEAVKDSGRNIPLKKTEIGIRGQIIY